MSITEDTDYKRRQKVNELERLKDKAAVIYMLEDERGRWFLSRLMDACGTEREMPDDVNKIFIAEGKRRIGLYIEDFIRSIEEAQTEAYEKGEINIKEARRRAEDEYREWSLRKLRKEDNNEPFQF